MERLLLVCGIILVAIYCAARIEGFLSSRSALKSFDAPNASAVLAEPAGENIVAPSEVDFTLWDDHRVQAYKQSLAEPPGAPLAVLQISKIHLNVPVFNGTDDLTLNRGVGRILGTARPGQRGNIGIAGHRDGFFRGLKDLATGDTVELRTPQGTDVYMVDKIDIVSPSDVEVLRPRAVPSLTLVTCYPFYYVGSAPERYVVTASLFQGEQSDAGTHASNLLSQTSSSERRGK